jgi:hypothetical protein
VHPWRFQRPTAPAGAKSHRVRIGPNAALLELEIIVVDTEKAVSRRRFFMMSLAGVAGASIALVSTTARVEARPKWR